MPDTAEGTDAWNSLERASAPHGGRLIAFAIDLVIVLLVSLTVGGGWFRILAVFIAYHTAMLWLTGQTIGKAVANLEVTRVGPPLTGSRRALWALGRVSVGYLLVDMLGLGVLVAFLRRNPGRRCLHDVVFGSRVVLRSDTEWALPKVRKRLSDFARRRENASRQLAKDHPEPKRLSQLWHWMATAALGFEQVLDLLQHIVTQVSSWFGGAGSSHAGAGTVSTKTAAVVAAGSTAVTVGAVATIALSVGAPDASVEGAWTTRPGSGRFVMVRQTGSDEYAGQSSADRLETVTGCTFRASQIRWRFTGSGPKFHGTELWVQGLDGEDCDFFRSPGEFVLDDRGTDDPTDDSLHVCSTSTRTDVERCHDYLRA